MARVCAICNRGKSMGNHRKLLRGHYNVTGRRTFAKNLQSTLYEGKRVLACVRCIRTQAKHLREA